MLGRLLNEYLVDRCCRWFVAEAPHGGRDGHGAGPSFEIPRREASRSYCPVGPVATLPLFSSVSGGIFDRSHRVGYLLPDRLFQGSFFLRPVGITGDNQEVGGLPVSSHDSQSVYN